jgi:hypothetical protein
MSKPRIFRVPDNVPDNADLESLKFSLDEQEQVNGYSYFAKEPANPAQSYRVKLKLGNKRLKLLSRLLNWLIAAVIGFGLGYGAWAWLYLNIPAKVLVQPAFKSELTYRQNISLTQLTPVTVTVEVTATVQATGQADQPDKRAVGTVRLVNGGGAVTIPAGTIFGKARLKAAVSVPGLVLDYGSGAGRLGVTGGMVEAVELGEAGNGGGWSGWQGQVRIEVSPLTGGTNRKGQKVTDSDIEKLKAALDTQLTAKVSAALDNALPLNIERVKRVDIAGKQYQHPPVGSEASGFTGKLTAQVTGYSYEQSGLLDLVISSPTERTGLKFGELLETAGGQLTLTYSRPVNEQSLRYKLSGWTGNRAELHRLISEVSGLPEVARILVGDVPKDYPGKLIIILEGE